MAVDSAPAAITIPSTTSRPRRNAHEVRHLLRAATAAAMAGRRRTEALPGRADAAGDRRPARLRPCLGGRASFPGGIFAFAVAGIVPRRRQPAHQEYPARPRHLPAHHQPSGARRRAGRGARSPEQRPLRIRHGRERLDHRTDAVRPRHGDQEGSVRGGRAAPSSRCSRTAAASITASISIFPCAMWCQNRCRSRIRRCGWHARNCRPSSAPASTVLARSASSSSAPMPRMPGCMPITTPSPSG